MWYLLFVFVVDVVVDVGDVGDVLLLMSSLLML